MNQQKQYSRFLVLNESVNHIEVIAAGMMFNHERAGIIQLILKKNIAVTKVECDVESNILKISFDSEVISASGIFSILDKVLKNFPTDFLSVNAAHSAECGLIRPEKEEEIVFSIQGMSCTSCAKFLELILARETNVKQANVSYISGEAKIRGYIKKENIFNIIEKNGYHACI